MRIFKSSNFANAYKDVLKTALVNPDYVVAPRNEKTYELSNVVIELSDPQQNLFSNKIQAPSLKYLAGELIWYFSGSNSLDFISKYSKFWGGLPRQTAHVIALTDIYCLTKEMMQGLLNGDGRYSLCVKILIHDKQ